MEIDKYDGKIGGLSLSSFALLDSILVKVPGNSVVELEMHFLNLSIVIILPRKPFSLSPRMFACWLGAEKGFEARQ